MTSSDDNAGRRRLTVSGISLLAGSAAAATGALAASALGVAGTVIGAALASALVTLAAAVYDHSLRRAHERIEDRRAATQVRQRSRDARASASSGAQPPDDPGESLPLDALDLEDERGYHWRRIAVVALVVFVLGMAAVTGFELLTGRPLAALWTGDQGSGTTIGDVVRNRDRLPTTPASPTPSPSRPPVTPTPTPTPSTPTPSLTPSPSVSSTPTGPTSSSPAP